MPDKNKLKVFKNTNMVLFKACVLCKHGEIPNNTTWGYCKHPDHFYTHGRHGRLPGTSHASMGCDDFRMKNVVHRDMLELGPYLKLVPLYDTVVTEAGTEEVGSEEVKTEKVREREVSTGKRTDTMHTDSTDVNNKPQESAVEIQPKSEEKTQSQPQTAQFTGTFPTPPEDPSSKEFISMAPTASEKTPASKEATVASSSSSSSSQAKSSRSTRKSTKSSSRRSSKSKTSSEEKLAVKQEASEGDASYEMVPPTCMKTETTLQEDSP